MTDTTGGECPILGYKELDKFLTTLMRMMSTCQPRVIKKLLQSDRYTATVDDLARTFTDKDGPLLRYYRDRIKFWAIIALEKRYQIVRYDKHTKSLTLLLEEVGPNKRSMLIDKCDSRITEYMQKPRNVGDVI